MLLPRVLDAIEDILDMLAYMGGYLDDEHLEMLVLDFVDAFFLLPLKDNEKRSFTATSKKKFFIWQRVAQGSTNGPQLFGRTSALASRFTQSLSDESRMRQQTYTDDPWMVLGGTPDFTKRMRALVILVWQVLGFTLAFPKGQKGVPHYVGRP